VQSVNATVAKEIDVPRDISSQPKSTSYSLLSKPRRWFHGSALRILLLELRSLVHRIRWVFQIRAAEHLLGKATVHRWMDEALIPAPEPRQRDCIRYIEKTLSLHPFLSIFDILLLTKTWKAGSEWSDRNNGTSQSPHDMRS
jgi:hypothetical protein